MRIINKAVWFEFRTPQTKEEKGVYGLTESTCDVAKIFINTRLKSTHFAETFFHELAHVFFSFMYHKVPKHKQEELARKIGVVCAEVLR